MSFSAYNGNNRPPPRNYYTPRNRNSNDPPEILPEFRSTPESMQRSYIARQQDQHERAVRQQIENEIRYHEERTEFGMKQINPDEFDEEDEHAIPMAPVYSRFNPPPQIIKEVRYLPRPKKHKKEKKSKKKHKKRSSSSSSSDESGKRNRKRHLSREDGNSGDEDSGNGQGTSSSSAKRPRIQDQISLNEVSKNPFKLLRVGELKYCPSHLIEDRKHDLENRKYDAAYKHEVATYKGRNKPDDKKNLRAVSELFPELMKNWHIAHKDRLFNHFKKWNIGIERKFRQRPDELGHVDVVQISRHKLDGIDGAASVKITLDDNMCRDMNAEDYEHFVKSEAIKCKEPEPFGIDIKDQYSVLHNRVTMNKLDVDGWMEFIDIQRPFHAKNESGDQNAGIQNRKAYFERVIDIVKKAIAANPGNGDLQIKKLQIMQEHFGVNTPEVKQEWARLENHLVNSIQMWEGNLKMCINDRSMFKLDQIKKIDRCLNKLASLKYGIMSSHRYLEGTDEFLVKLLVVRCRLLIVTGHLDKAIGMLQALAEFHFFRPTEMDTPRRMADRWVLAKEEFKKFWESGNLRIGEESAEGWIKYDEFSKQEEWRDDEGQILDGSMNEIFGDEQSEMEEYKKTEGTSLMEARCRLEEYRSKHYWKPIYFEHENKDLFMFDTRIIKFSDIENVLFPLDDDQLIQDLIFKLFHIFGIPIPGLKFNCQEDVLRSFSSDLFQSRRPNALGLAKFDDFFTHFIILLAESPHMDSARIYTALATKISTSSMEKNKKIKKLKELRNDAVNGKLKRCYLWTNLSVCSNSEYLLSILVVICDELWKLQKGADYNTLLSFMKYLNTNLDAKNISLWDIGADVEDPEQRKLKMRERTLNLRFILYIVRNLPFSDEEGASTKMQNIKKKEDESPATKTFTLKTRKEFLLSLWANGNITEVPDHQEEDAIQRAKKRVTECLKKGAPRDQESLQWRWIGNEPEIVFELAALFCYEFPFKSEVQRYKFFQEDKPLFVSELANSLSDSPVIQEMRVKVLQHIMEVRRGLEFTPSNLVDFLNQQVPRFPHSIPLLKTLIDVTKGFNERVYLYKNPGNDDLTQLIRSCSEIYIQRLKLQNEMDELNKEERDRIVENSLRIFKKMADKNSNTLFMDDYIWTLLMRIAVIARESITNNKITEIFNLGQKVCPWSKELLFNAVRNRAPNEETSLLTTMNELMSTHGLHQYVCDSEVLAYMTEQIS